MVPSLIDFKASGKRICLLLLAAFVMTPSAKAALDTWGLVAEPGVSQLLNVTRAGQVQLGTDTGLLYLGSGSGLTLQPTPLLPAPPQLMSAGFQTGSFSEGSGRIFYAVVEEDEVYRSGDAGANWALLSTDMPIGTVTAIAGAPSDTHYVYIGMESGGVYYYSRFNNRWTDVTLTLPAGKVSRLAVAPGDAGIVYAAIEGEGVYKLVKPKQTFKWIKVSNLMGILDIAVDPSTPHEALISSGGTVERIESNNRVGNSWSIRDGLPGGAVIWGLAYDPADSDFAYVGTTRGVYKFNRGLGFWSRLGEETDLAKQHVVAMAVDPRNPKVVYAGTNDALGGGRLYRIEQSVSSNVPPIPTAEASSGHVASFDTVVLDGASSTDPDGFIISYQWVELNGVGVTITGNDTPSASFVAPDVTLPITLKFQLEVKDNKNAWAGKQVEVVVSPHGYQHGLEDDAELTNGGSGEGGGGGTTGWGLLLLPLLLMRRTKH